MLHRTSLTARQVPALALIDDLFQTAQRSSARSLPLHITETADAYLLKASLPGLSKEDIQIEIDGSTLSLSGTRKEQAILDGQSLLFSEIPTGPLHRTITFAQEIHAPSSQAQFEQGILSLTLSKVMPTKISLKIQ